jgi:hypothetical protein
MPPDAVVGLLNLPFFAEIENRQNQQSRRGQSQQRRLCAVKEVCLHGDGSRTY